MSRQHFESLITSKVNTKYGSKEYAIKRDKTGEYVKYETRIAWEWWCKHKDYTVDVFTRGS